MSQTKSIIICAMFAALISIGAFIKIPIFLVPMTLQFLFVNMAVLLLGKKLGFYSVLTYLIVGLSGFPVFAKGGGVAYILQPTFGYLIGFLVGNYVTGAIIEKFEVKTPLKLCLASLVNLSIIYLIGVCYYQAVSMYYLESPLAVFALLWYCFIITLPGDLLSVVVSVYLAPRIKPFLPKK